MHQVQCLEITALTAFDTLLLFLCQIRVKHLISGINYTDTHILTSI